MKRNNKKGFTIVELVIVIAVIAILAAVLIPTFSSVIKKAKVNNDIQLVRNLNTALATDTKEHKTMQSALDAAFEFGYDVAKINDTSVDENKILWDSKNDVFCYLKDSTLEYVPNSVADGDKLSADSYLLWTISKTVDTTFSTYLYNYEVTETTKKVIALKGLDVGKTEGITEIEYVNNAEGATHQNVVIRTNSAGTDIILAPFVDPTDNTKGDHIDFYGSCGQFVGPKDGAGNYTGFTIAFNSLAVNGKTVGMKVAGGHVDLTNAVVDEGEEIILLATTANVKVSNPNNVANHAHTTSEENANTMNDTTDVAKKSIGVTWDYDGNTAQNELNDIYHHITDAEAAAAGITEKVDGGWTYEAALTVKIAEAIQKESNENPACKIGNAVYASFDDAVAALADMETAEIVLNKDITIIFDTAAYITVKTNQNITIDLNGYTITAVSKKGSTSYFINNAGTLTLKDSKDSTKDGSAGAIIMNAIKPDTDWDPDNQPTEYPGYANNAINNGGKLTIESGKFTNATPAGGATYVVDNNSGSGNAVLIINGGCLYNDNNDAIRLFCNSTTNENSVTINGGIVGKNNKQRCIWLQIPNANNGKGTITVNDGKIIGSISSYSGAHYGYISHSQVANVSVTVLGGYFESTICCECYQSEDSVTTIKGGTFKENKAEWGYRNLAENGSRYWFNFTSGEGSTKQGTTFSGYTGSSDIDEFTTWFASSEEWEGYTLEFDSNYMYIMYPTIWDIEANLADGFQLLENNNGTFTVVAAE